MAELYDKSSKRIYDFLYKYTGNSDVAMDLMQDTFLSFFRRYSGKEFGEDEAMKLLYTIARNKSINYAKKFSTQKETATTDLFEVKSKAQTVERSVELGDLEDKLRACLDQLPEEEKTAMILRFMQDMNLSDIASFLNVSVSTASRIIVRATAKMMEMAKLAEIKPD